MTTQKVLGIMSEYLEGVRIGYPQIGAGHAGGDWEKINSILESKLVGVDKTLVIYDKK